MIDRWLDWPSAPLIGVLALLYGASAVVLYLLVFKFATRRFAASLAGTAPPFFGAVAILFALLTSFLGSDVAARNKEAARAVHAESDYVLALHTLSIAASSDMAAIRGALHAYVQSAITDEWPQLGDAGASEKTEQALQALLREVSDPAIATASGAAVQAALVNTVLRIRSARAERLALANDRTSNLKWATVLILGLLTQAAIALVHLERPRPHLAALTLFSAAAVVALGLIALQERPFDGPLEVSPAPLETALRSMAAG